MRSCLKALFVVPTVLLVIPLIVLMTLVWTVIQPTTYSRAFADSNFFAFVSETSGAVAKAELSSLLTGLVDTDSLSPAEQDAVTPALQNFQEQLDELAVDLLQPALLQDVVERNIALSLSYFTGQDSQWQAYLPKQELRSIFVNTAVELLPTLAQGGLSFAINTTCARDAANIAVLVENCFGDGGDSVRLDADQLLSPADQDAFNQVLFGAETFPVEPSVSLLEARNYSRWIHPALIASVFAVVTWFVAYFAISGRDLTSRLRSTGKLGIITGSILLAAGVVLTLLISALVGYIDTASVDISLPPSVRSAIQGGELAIVELITKLVTSLFTQFTWNLGLSGLIIALIGIAMYAWARTRTPKENVELAQLSDTR